jgi:AhpD family alkylhydroperoxidase
MSLRMDYNAASPEGIRALRRVDGYLLQSGLSKSLLELVYLRISQINGCACCINKHSGDLLKGGMDLEKVLLVGVWREADGHFDEVERAGLAWAESVTRVADTNVPDADYQAAAAMFDEKQLADLTIAIATMNAYNRLAISFRVPPAAARQRETEVVG